MRRYEEDRMYGGGIWKTEGVIACGGCREQYDVSVCKTHLTLVLRAELTIQKQLDERARSAEIAIRTHGIRPAAMELLRRVKMSGRTYLDWSASASKLVGRPISEEQLRRDVGRDWDWWAEGVLKEKGDAFVEALVPNSPIRRLRLEAGRFGLEARQCREASRSFRYPVIPRS